MIETILDKDDANKIVSCSKCNVSIPIYVCMPDKYGSYLCPSCSCKDEE